MKEVVIGKLQPTLMRGSSRVLLAGDYLGTLNTESAITMGFSAAQKPTSLLATERQQGQRTLGIGGLTSPARTSSKGPIDRRLAAMRSIFCQRYPACASGATLAPGSP